MYWYSWFNSFCLEKFDTVASWFCKCCCDFIASDISIPPGFYPFDFFVSSVYSVQVQDYCPAEQNLDICMSGLQKALDSRGLSNQALSQRSDSCCCPATSPCLEDDRATAWRQNAVTIVNRSEELWPNPGNDQRLLLLYRTLSSSKS